MDKEIEEKENPEAQEVPTEKSKRDAFLEIIRAKYPELNTEDEDVVYGQAASDYNDYDTRLSESKKNEDELANLLSSDPRSADFLMNWKKGEDPVIVLLRTFGDEFREALDDPEKLEALATARGEYIARVAKNKELEEQSAQNLDESLNNLDAVVADGGYDETQRDNAWEFFERMVLDAVVNKVTKETWQFVFKSLNYDKDVQAAQHEGEIRGKNTKIDENRRKTTMPESIPPTLGGAGGQAEPPKPKSLGALDRAGEPSIFDRG